MQQQAEKTMTNGCFLIHHNSSQRRFTKISNSDVIWREISQQFEYFEVIPSTIYDAILKFTSAAYAMDLNVVIPVRTFAAVSYGIIYVLRSVVTSDRKKLRSIRTVICGNKNVYSCSPHVLLRIIYTPYTRESLSEG